MILLQNDEQLKHISSLIHEGTQKHEACIDLTVASVTTVENRGELDFGGSEFKAASGKSMEPVKRNADDDYGWWELGKGTYRAIFNEEIGSADDALYLLYPHEHTEAAAIQLNSRFLTASDFSGKVSSSFYVPSSGVAIKENARFASITIIGS